MLYPDPWRASLGGSVTRSVGSIDRQSIETIWWYRELAEERFATTPSAEAIANGVALRGGAWLASAQERLADYPDALVAGRCERAAERWGGWTPRGILTIVRDDTALARMEWLVDSAQRTLQIVFAINRMHQPTAKRLAERLKALDVQPERMARLRERARRDVGTTAQSGPLEVRAIIPGRVVAVSVAEGDTIEAGDQLLVVEAMKMQNELRSPRAGVVERIAVGVGQTVDLGAVLVVLR